MHFHSDKTYKFSDLVLYGFLVEGDLVKLNAYILDDNNGWEGVFELPKNVFDEKVMSDFSPELKEKEEVFFPDFFSDPPMFNASELSWEYLKSVLEEDEEFGDEMIYFFKYKA